MACRKPAQTLHRCSIQITRPAAIAVLKDKEPGSFLIRDSNSFQGAYGLALKVATPPPNANITGSKGTRDAAGVHVGSLSHWKLDP